MHRLSAIVVGCVGLQLAACAGAGDGATQGREVVRITDAAGLPGPLVDDVLRVVNDPATLRSFGNLNIEAATGQRRRRRARRECEHRGSRTRTRDHREWRCAAASRGGSTATCW